jgi:hypothetical protein
MSAQHFIMSFYTGWMKRFREIIENHGLLAIYSESSRWDDSKIEKIIGKE